MLTHEQTTFLKQQIRLGEVDPNCAIALLAELVREHILSLELLALRVSQFRDPDRSEDASYFQSLMDAQIIVDSTRRAMRQLVLT